MIDEAYYLVRDLGHAKKVRRKVARIDGLRALLETHEAAAVRDYGYIRDLKRRLKAAENQLRVMRP
jgi:hypothetical protein